MPKFSLPFDLDAVVEDVAETSTTEGQGTFDLAGAITGFDTLADHLGLAAGDKQAVKYLIVRPEQQENPRQYEVGLGQLTAGSPDTLTREVVLDSSEANGGLESFDWGEKRVAIFRQGAEQAGKVLDDFRDVFGVQIADGRTTELDLGAHYNYSSERWRVRRNGTRQFPEYGAVSGFTDAVDHYDLAPAQGDTMVLESTNRPRYTVQYELVRTMACTLSRQLETGDVVKVGHFDGTDGWFLEKNDTHGSGEGDFVVIRAGSEVSRKAVTIDEPLTAQQTRLSFAGPWYDIGRTVLGQSFALNGVQQNRVLATTSSKARGPQTGNLPIRYEVTRGGAASALTLECGSAGVVTRGTASTRSRTKPFTETAAISTTGVWEPLLAIRIDPDNPYVNVQLSSIHVINYSANSDSKVSARAFAPEHVHESDGTPLDDADFGTIEVALSQNTALQTSTAVTEVIRRDGVTFDGAIDPSAGEEMGGYQIGFDELIDAKEEGLKQLNIDNVRNAITPLDVVVIMGFAASATGDITFALSPEEDW